MQPTLRLMNVNPYGIVTVASDSNIDPAFHTTLALSFYSVLIVCTHQPGYLVSIFWGYPRLNLGQYSTHGDCMNRLSLTQKFI